MSFLNPVNEPVLRFKSTDAGAPQINYNARVAGDVKAVLKACLVTGYGATASAGWSVVNEVNHVAEFVSPSAAMSDYRLGVDDSTVSKTDWFFRYQDVRTNPRYSSPSKSFVNVDKTHASNSWQLLVTDRGLIFLELVYSTYAKGLSARLTYLSQVKSALVATTGVNMMFFNIGHSAQIASYKNLYSSSYPYLALSTFIDGNIFSSTPLKSNINDYSKGVSAVDITSNMYAAGTSDAVFLCQLPGLLNKVVNKTSDMYVVTDTVVDGRPALSICCGDATNFSLSIFDLSATFLIYLDYWEY